MTTTHDFGDCEKWEGVMCEECRIEYMTRWDDLDQQDYWDETYFER